MCCILVSYAVLFSLETLATLEIIPIAGPQVLCFQHATNHQHMDEGPFSSKLHVVATCLSVGPLKLNL